MASDLTVERACHRYAGMFEGAPKPPVEMALLAIRTLNTQLAKRDHNQREFRVGAVSLVWQPPHALEPASTRLGPGAFIHSPNHGLKGWRPWSWVEALLAGEIA